VGGGPPGTHQPGNSAADPVVCGNSEGTDEGQGVGQVDVRRERENYLRELGEKLDRGIQVVWTGPGTRSLTITKGDIHGYTQVLGRAPILWDNTLYAHRSAYGYDARHPYYLFDLFQSNITFILHKQTFDAPSKEERDTILREIQENNGNGVRPQGSVQGHFLKPEELHTYQ